MNFIWNYKIQSKVSADGRIYCCTVLRTREKHLTTGSHMISTVKLFKFSSLARTPTLGHCALVSRFTRALVPLVPLAPPVPGPRTVPLSSLLAQLLNENTAPATVRISLADSSKVFRRNVPVTRKKSAGTCTGRDRRNPSPNNDTD